MGDPRRLGQAGGPGSVDEKGGVPGGQTLPHGGGRRLGRALGKGGGQVAFSRQGRIQAPKTRRVVQVAQYVLQGRRGLPIHNHLMSAGQGEAVGQGLACELVIDEGRDHPDLGQAIPGGQVLDPVGQEEGHPVPGPQTDLKRPSREAVGQGLHSCVGEASPLETQGLAVGPSRRRRVEVVTDAARTSRMDPLHPAKRPEQAGGEPEVTLERREHSEAVSFDAASDL